MANASRVGSGVLACVMLLAVASFGCGGDEEGSPRAAGGRGAAAGAGGTSGASGMSGSSGSSGSSGTSGSSGSGGTPIVPDGEYPPPPTGVPAGCAADVLAQHAHDHAPLPDYGASPTVSAAKSGAWSDPSVWKEGRVPAAGDVVAIANAAIDFDSTVDAAVAAVAVRAGGRLTFSTAKNTRLSVTTLEVFEGGELTVGGAAGIVPAGVTAEIVIADAPLNTTRDPEQWGHGIIAEGKVSMHGAVKTPYVRLAEEPLAGQTKLVFKDPVVGWESGDEIGLPDTRQLNPEERFGDFEPRWEKVKLASVAADGLSVVLSAAIAHDHPASRAADGTREFFPHAGNLTRNVRVRSAASSGVRGHTLFHRRADVDIRYAAFQDLGRTTDDSLDSTTFDASGAVTHVGTNQIGRYALHAHHLFGPAALPADGYQFKFIGNAVVGSTKWPLTVHDSHFGLIFRNVVYSGDGAGIVTEDGNESYNLFQQNFSLAITGRSNPRDNDGRGGEAFWFNGFGNYMRANVGASSAGIFQQIVSGCGYKFLTAPAGNKVEIPTCRGADTQLAAGSPGLETVDTRYIPIRGFEDNEAYGAIAAGLTIWHLNNDGYGQGGMGPQTVLKNFTVWHAWEEGFFGYPIENVLFDGFVMRGDPALIDNQFSWTMGFTSGDYWMQDTTIRNADIRGVSTGYSGFDQHARHHHHRKLLLPDTLVGRDGRNAGDARLEGGHEPAPDSDQELSVRGLAGRQFIRLLCRRDELFDHQGPHRSDGARRGVRRVVQRRHG